MSTNENTSQEVYSRVTSQIVNAIEQGVSSWRMPWHTSGKFAFSPINVTSKKPYRGINTVCLWAAAQAKGYGYCVVTRVPVSPLILAAEVGNIPWARGLSGSCPKSVITFQPVAAAGRSSDRWLQ